MLLVVYYQGNWGALVDTRQGIGLLVGLTLATLLTAFHFVAEPRLDGMICNARDEADIVLTDRVLGLLKIVPRVGLVVITTIVVLMMYTSHGL